MKNVFKENVEMKTDKKFHDGNKFINKHKTISNIYKMTSLASILRQFLWDLFN